MTVETSYSKRDDYKNFIYNPKEKTFLGHRTWQSWAKLGIFYLIFYGVLAAFVAFCGWIFYQTLDPRIPKRQMSDSLVINPGLGFRPMPTNDPESTLIWLRRTKQSNETTNKFWINNLLQFLDKYYFPSKTARGNDQIKTCTFSNWPTRTEICEVDVRQWEECNKDQYFNYHKTMPCIFIKLNRIYGWEPDYYDNPLELPEEMPQQLKDHISSLAPNQRKTVWVSCEGEYPGDKEYMGPIDYYPRIAQGFPGYYFPYRNAEGYLSPLVAIQFTDPYPGIVINVECRAWAKNIPYSRRDKLGSVHFELLID